MKKDFGGKKKIFVKKIVIKIFCLKKNFVIRKNVCHKKDYFFVKKIVIKIFASYKAFMLIKLMLI